MPPHRPRVIHAQIDTRRRHEHRVLRTRRRRGASSVQGERDGSGCREDASRKGTRSGTARRFVQSGSPFTRAAVLAPQWPYPIYDRAFTHLQARDAAAPWLTIGRTLELSPRGFFTAHVAVDALRREQKGEAAARGSIWRMSCWSSCPTARDVRSFLNWLRNFRTCSSAWLEFAKLASAPRERLDRIEAGLRARPDPETRGMLHLNQALTLRQSGQDADANRILAQVAADPGSTLAVEAWAKALLAKKDR